MRIFFLSLSLFCSASCFAISQPQAEDSIWSLHAAEAHALEHNPELRALREALQQGQLRSLQAIARYLPQVSIDGTADRAWHGPLQRYRWKTGSSLRFMQRLISGQDYSNVKLTRSDEQRLEHALEDLKTQLLFAVRSSYYTIVLGQEQLEVQETNIKTLQEEWKREQARLELGESTAFAVMRARVAVTNAQTSLHSAVRDLRIARNDFLQILGIDPDRDVRLSSSEIPVTEIDLLAGKLAQAEQAFAFSPAEIAAFEAQALQKNPQIASARVELRQTSERLTQRYSEYLPNVNAFAHYHNSSTPVFSFGGAQSSWDLGVEFRYNIFDGLGRERRVQEARSKQREQAFRQEAAIRQVMLELHNQFHQVEQALHAYKDAQEGVHLAEQALQEARDRRDLGFLTQLEFRDTTQSLLLARLQFNQASFALLQAYYGLQRASGVDL